MYILELSVFIMYLKTERLEEINREDNVVFKKRRSVMF